MVSEGPPREDGREASRLAALVSVLSPGRLLPVEQVTLLSVAGAVGIYAGLAAGLLSNFIRLFQLLLYRGTSVIGAVVGHDPSWRHAFRAQLRSAPWHLEFVAVALVLIVAGVIGERIVLRRSGRPVLARRARTMGYAFAFGLTLYYPLLTLASWNRSFGDTPGLYDVLQSSSRILWVIVPTVGGLLAGLLVRYVSPESAGHGVGEVLETIAQPKRRIRGRVAFWKSMASGLVIGSGGSAGREGPVVQMGGAVANFLGSRLELRPRDVSLLLVCGGGAGIAASFNAPFGGMAFALEILLGDLGTQSLAPIVLSAVTATITGRALIGAGGEIGSVTYDIKSPVEILIYVLLGVFAGVCSILYIKSIHGTERLFEGRGPTRVMKLSQRLAALRPEFRAAVGGFGVGLIGLLAPRALGNGYESMNAALLGGLGAGTLALVLVAKIATSGLTLGSGSPGGSFFPAVFIGAMAGGLFGVIGHRIAPGLVAGSGPYAAVGMGAVVAGATLAPLTGIVMLFELTRAYSIVIPLMVACGLSTLLVRRWLGGSMYTLKLREKGVRRPERDTVLSALMVADVELHAPPASIPPSTPLDEVVRRISTAPVSALGVDGTGGPPAALIEWRHLRPVLGRQASDGRTTGPAVKAADLVREKPVVVTPTTPLEQALRLFAESGTEHALVVDAREPNRVIGLLSLADVLNGYLGGRHS
jgi:CIC family chloride channel protein